MRICKVHLKNVLGVPYSQSRQHEAEKLGDREKSDAYDERTWREKCTTNDEGQVCIPAMALKQSIDTAAYKLGLKVEGRRGATYKNFFSSGFLVDGDVPIANGHALTKNDAVMCKIYANTSGIRGSGKRVWRRFPNFNVWHGVAEFKIIDDIITKEVFELHVKAAGMIVGIGRFRPENGGLNGRFVAEKFEWGDLMIF